jgi:signal transduction histidine kinase
MNHPRPDPDESARLAALQRYDVLDSAPEESFDSIVQLAARTCRTPIALIALIDEARQWFKARVGLDVPETTRDISFCTHAVVDRRLYTVPDALADERFRENPLVRGDPKIRFYAGVPLITSDGFGLGALCVIDRKPRPGLTEHERESLELLARETMTQLELRRALKQLSDAKSEVDSMNLELDAFGAAVAHDMRAPLRHINGFVDLLAEECTSADASHHLDRIRTACVRMRDIIDALLRLSRAAHAPLLLQTVDLSSMVADVLAELHTGEPERTVETVVESGVAVRADAAMMRIALSNLISNAWKFTRAREVARIEFGREYAGGRTEYFVRDNGVGFDAARPLLPAKPFTRHLSAEGVGLGLTIVERIVRRHGGTLRADGAAGQGAKFSFSLEATSD